jgi:hypothetical protein
MSTPEYEMFLRAMRSAADSIEPRSDGLDQIRARLHRRPYPLPVAWAAAACMRLTLWLPEGAFSAGRLAYSARRQVAGKLRLVSERFRPEPASDRLRSIFRWFLAERPEPTSGPLRSISQWFLAERPEPAAEDARRGKSSAWSLLRPLTAFGVAVFIVAVGAYVAIEVPAVVSTQSGNSPQQGVGGGSSSTGRNGEANNSSSPFPSTRPSGWPALPSPSGTCYPTLGPLGPSGGASPSGSPTHSPSRTASPSPTGSGSPSSSSSPSPTPSGTATPSSSASAPATAGQQTPGAGAGAARATTDAVILAANAAAPSVQTSNSPCSTPRPRKSTKRPRNATSTPGLSGSFRPAEPARHQSSRFA